jgi:hypothetical protein
MPENTRATNHTIGETTGGVRHQLRDPLVSVPTHRGEMPPTGYFESGEAMT